MPHCCLRVSYPTRNGAFRVADRTCDPQPRRTGPRRLVTKSAAFAALFVCFVGGAATASAAQSGIASVYDYSGTRTADGRWASPGSLTAAHRTLPFGTLVRVTNDRNGRSVVVRIEDRGPFVRGASL